MSCECSFLQKVSLELNHAVLKQRIEDHELHQLLWVCIKNIEGISLKIIIFVTL